MAIVEVKCPDCGAVSTYDGHLPFREECERCCADLHVCLTCRFHDRFAADECRETSADPVATKDRRNLCEYWKTTSSGDDVVDDAAAAKAKLAALFGGAAAATTQAGSQTPSTEGSSLKPVSKSDAEIAKEKLAALFGDK